MLFSVKDLEKRFGKKQVLQDINFDLQEDEILGLIGMSGAGKSVLMKTIVGFHKPTKGNILYRDKDVKKIKNFQRNFGFSTQESCFYPELSVLENVEHFGKLYGLRAKDARDRAINVLEELGLGDDKKTMASRLSGGMAKRLDLACSLIHSPELLFLDEPTLELDPILRKEIIKLIKRINEAGVSVIITSHLLGGVEELCNRIGILHKGKMIEIGDINELRKLYGRNEEIVFSSYPGNHNAILKELESNKDELGIEFIQDRGDKIALYTREPEILLPYLIALLSALGEKIKELRMVKPSLGEVFREIIKKQM